MTENKLEPITSKWLKYHYTEEVKFIAGGTYGRVYSLLDPKDQTQKALKIIFMNPKIYETEEEWAKESKREIDILKKLGSSPFILELYDHNIEFQPNQMLLVMELAETSLDKYLKIDRKKRTDIQPLEDAGILKLINCLSGGLEYAITKGINHRDIKPENILIMNDGNFKIADWGAGYICRNKFGTRLATSIIGTPGFYAPELLYIGEQFNQTQIMNQEEFEKNIQVNWEKADIFSCGIVILESCGIYWNEFEKIKREEGEKRMEKGLEKLLNEKLVTGLRQEMIKFIMNMCRVERKDRWGIKEFRDEVVKINEKNSKIQEMEKILPTKTDLELK